jgi:mRNA-degrading endonuclease RelE of RelBE toxin-antitoxin system
MAAKRIQAIAKIKDPEKMLAPEDLLHFVELDGFVDEWESFKPNVETDLEQLMIGIMANPQAAPVIKGTGGLRKLRFSPDKMRIGKSGAFRVCYAYFEEHWIVMLITVYKKGQTDTLDAADKKAIRDLILETKKYLDERN